MEGFSFRKAFFTLLLMGCLALVTLYVLAPTLNVRYNRQPNFLKATRNTTTFVGPSRITATLRNFTVPIRPTLKNVTLPVKTYLYKEMKKPDCNDRQKWKYKPMSTHLPLTALASPWRSGNTWIRHLLQMATGIGTTSQYCDMQLQRNGFPFECEKKDFSKFIVKKTHEPTMVQRRPYTILTRQNFARAVVIIRDPYTFIVANVYSGHLESVPESNYFSTKFQTIGQPKSLGWWNSFNNYWLKEFKGEVYPVLYTNFLRDVRKELRKLLFFLGVEFTEEDIACAASHTEGNFHRKPRVWTQISNIKELFSRDMQRQIDMSVRNMSELLLTNYNVTWVNDTYTVQSK